MRTNFTKITFVMLAIIMSACNLKTSAQYWKATGALSGAGSATYLIGATHVGETIYVLSSDGNFAYSTNRGESWTKQTISGVSGTKAAITGVSDRLYLSTKINTYDFELYYSMDNGASWVLDTIGLPKSLTGTGKSGMILRDMGDDYVLAYNYTKAVYKKLGDPDWKQTNIDNVIVNIAATSSAWIAIGQVKLLKSTDKGASWIQMGTSGLPASFQGSQIASNGSRIYVSTPPAAGGVDIYFSDDESNWTLTNSAGKFNYDNPWVQNIYAVDDYIFAAISPKFANFQDPPPFIISSSATPDFSVGDISGLPTGGTTSNLPFFFHIGNQLFTMFWDLYSSEPGFTEETTTSVNLPGNTKSVVIYPNPVSQFIKIQSNNLDISNLEIFTLGGEKVFQQSTPRNNVLDISSLRNGLYLIKTTSTNGQTFQSKFIKQ